MMNMDAILDYTRDPNEDFYQVLGCHRLSTTEQIQTEFKIRAKECHPDKQKNITESNPERFQLLLKVRHTISVFSRAHKVTPRLISAGKKHAG